MTRRAPPETTPCSNHTDMPDRCSKDGLFVRIPSPRSGYVLQSRKPRSEKMPRAAPLLLGLGKLPGGLAVILGLVIAGCAGVYLSPADQLLRRGDYNAAVAAYQSEETRRPDDPATKRCLGIALLRSGNPVAAVAKLNEAHSLDSLNTKTLFFLAQAQAQLDSVDDALQSYQTYLCRGGKRDRAVRVQIHALSQQKVSEYVWWALEHEDNLATIPSDDSTLAVYDFVNSANDETLAPLSRGLASMLITDLKKVKQLRLVERAKLQVLMAELRLGADQSAQVTDLGLQESTLGIKRRLHTLTRPHSRERYYNGPMDEERGAEYLSAVRLFQSDWGLQVDGIAGPKTRDALEKALQHVNDTSSAPRHGHLLRAGRLVQGSFMRIGTEAVELSAELVGIDGERTVTGSPVDGALRDVLWLEKELTYQILESLGIEPTPEEKKEIDKLPTEDFLAFLAFNRGLQLEEEGKFDEAKRAYENALDRDPGFDEVREAEDLVDVTDQDLAEADEAELSESFERDGGGQDDEVVREIAVSVGGGSSPDEGEDTEGMEHADGVPGDGSDQTPNAPEKLEPPSIPEFPPPPDGGKRR